MSNRINRKALVFNENSQYLNPLTLGKQIINDPICASNINTLDRETVWYERYTKLRIQINHHIARDDFDDRYYRK